MRQTWRFLGRLTLAMVVLWLVWIPVGASYRQLVVAVGNAVFSVSGPNLAVEFREFRDWRSLGLDINSRADVAVLVRRPQWVDAQGREQHLLAQRIVTFAQPYAAGAFLVALFAASPGLWRKRWWSLAAALLVLHVMMVGCVLISVLHTFAAQGAWPGLARGMGEVLAVLNATVTDWPSGVFLVPLVIWVVAWWPARSRPVSDP